MKKILILFALLSGLMSGFTANAQRMSLDKGWKFAFGNASDPAKDFGCGTEYFNYLTKANSVHNEGPYSLRFDPAVWPVQWVDVDLPHDWVVDLPFAPEASHSHGYKCVGYKYPETSVGWYRKTITLDPADKGKHFILSFEGIFRDSRVWVNGFYMGGDPSGYACQDYDITDYLIFPEDGKSAENVICVRADATLEEGWFYEGGGIYRHVWLTKSEPVHIAPYGVWSRCEFPDGLDAADLVVEAKVENDSKADAAAQLAFSLYAPDGRKVAERISRTRSIVPAGQGTFSLSMHIDKPDLWSDTNPALYRLVSQVIVDGKPLDCTETAVGIRQIVFSADSGMIVNGRKVILKGVDLHQDHAGVGAAIPDGLIKYRLSRLKWLGANAIRGSHNPASPALLSLCDSMGFYIIDENRLLGVNDYFKDHLRNMIERGRSHPSVIMWSMGNEEWGVEWDPRGAAIVATMTAYAHTIDPSRPTTVATSGGPEPILGADIAGYNYFRQNPIDKYRVEYPSRLAYLSEETTGCGTRGVHVHEKDAEKLEGMSDHDYFKARNPSGFMPAWNDVPDYKTDEIFSRTQTGWEFVLERPWLAGVFYWTGFDYRGESNPMVYPATGSPFGLLDYCGNPKQEALYLRQVWGGSKEPWPFDSRKVAKNAGLHIESSRYNDITVYVIYAVDAKRRFDESAMNMLDVKLEGEGRIIGVGNGDNTWKAKERPLPGEDPRVMSVPLFHGIAQVYVQGEGKLEVSAR
ncbi:MAG: beta-galactosidase [Bacteroidales bacterium]|nr:beta-galactosidase [Bacteroidales bacterium]